MPLPTAYSLRPPACRPAWRSRWIRLGDGRGRDARVRMVSRQKLLKHPPQAKDGRTVKPTRLIKSPLDRGYEALRSRCEDDAELARQAAGRKVGPTDGVLLDVDGNILYAAEQVEILYDKDGREIERRTYSTFLYDPRQDFPPSRLLTRRCAKTRRRVSPHSEASSPAAPATRPGNVGLFLFPRREFFRRFRDSRGRYSAAAQSLVLPPERFAPRG